jgi:hypothetical protein
MSSPRDPKLAYLLSAQAVRERCHQMLDIARRGELTHFTLDEPRLDTVSEFVLTVTRDHYPLPQPLAAFRCGGDPSCGRARKGLKPAACGGACGK